jgi:hypothetical protein
MRVKRSVAPNPLPDGLPESKPWAQKASIWERSAIITRLPPLTTDERRRQVVVRYRTPTIQTIPGKGWNAILRLYGPLVPWFDKTWRPGEIEELK